MTANVVPFPQRPDPTTIPHRPGATPARLGSAVYTVTETAHILSLSTGTTYALLRSGEIPGIKLGGRWLVPKRRLHEWLDNLPEATTEDVAAEVERLDRADRADRPAPRRRNRA